MKNIKKIISIVSMFSIIATIATGCGSAKVGATKAIKTADMNSTPISTKDAKKTQAEREKADTEITTVLKTKSEKLINSYFNFNSQNVKTQKGKIIDEMLAEDNKDAYRKGIQKVIQNNGSEKMTSMQFQTVNSQPCPDNIAKQYNKQGYVAYVLTYQVGWSSSTGHTGTDTVTIEWLIKDKDIVLLNFADKNN